MELVVTRTVSLASTQVGFLRARSRPTCQSSSPLRSSCSSTSRPPRRSALPFRSRSSAAPTKSSSKLAQFAAPAQVCNWHHPEIPESQDYFRLLTCCGNSVPALDRGGLPPLTSHGLTSSGNYRRTFFDERSRCFFMIVGTTGLDLATRLEIK